jgi:hypothetical protein
MYGNGPDVASQVMGGPVLKTTRRSARHKLASAPDCSYISPRRSHGATLVDNPQIEPSAAGRLRQDRSPRALRKPGGNVTDEHFSDPSASRHGKHHLRTPSEELGRWDKLRREAMHRRILSGVLIMILAAGGLALAVDLDSWPEWVVLGGILFTVAGVIIATSPRRPA